MAYRAQVVKIRRTRNYYEILGLQRTASEDEIKRACGCSGLLSIAAGALASRSVFTQDVEASSVRTAMPFSPGIQITAHACRSEAGAEAAPRQMHSQRRRRSLQTYAAALVFGYAAQDLFLLCAQ